MAMGNEVLLSGSNGLVSAGDGISTDVGMWSFAGKTSQKFDEHVSKSVPFYQEGHELILKLSEHFITDDSVCYEIGSSTATLTKRLAEKYCKKNGRFVGLEVEQDMVDIARNKCDGLKSVELHCADATYFEYEKADLIVAYYTVQFVTPKRRQLLIDRLYECLNWGGALILFEKVRASDARFQDIVTQSYIDYKLDQGYSADEVISKSRSLKRVLEPFSTQGNTDLLIRAGFSDIMSVMKYLCFEGFMAIK